MENKQAAQATTPGPWKRVSNFVAYTVRGSNGYEIDLELFELARTHNNGNDLQLASAAPDMRQASQQLYDRLQEYLDASDEQLVEQGYDDLVKAMDDMEAAWHKADGTLPEPEDGSPT